MPRKNDDTRKSKKQRGSLTERVEFRCAPDIKQELEDRAAGHHVTLSGYLIACGLNKRMPNATLNGSEWQTLLKALGELGKVGSNLNQVARAINSGHHVEAEALKALQAVHRAGDELREILLRLKPNT